jgi:hypothetical protein
MLEVTVETIAGKEHKFFFDGDLKTLDNVMSSGPINCCDSTSLPTTMTKSFHPDNINVITTVEVNPTPIPTTKEPYIV